MTDAVMVALISAVGGAATTTISAVALIILRSTQEQARENWRQSHANFEKLEQIHKDTNGKVQQLIDQQQDAIQEKLVNAVLTGFAGGTHQTSEKRRQPDEPQPPPVNDPEPKE